MADCKVAPQRIELICKPQQSSSRLRTEQSRQNDWFWVKTTVHYVSFFSADFQGFHGHTCNFLTLLNLACVSTDMFIIILNYLIVVSRFELIASIVKNERLNCRENSTADKHSKGVIEYIGGKVPNTCIIGKVVW